MSDGERASGPRSGDLSDRSVGAAPPFFFYGSLRHAPLRAAVLGETPPTRPARAWGWRVVTAGPDGFPALWASGGAAEGVLVAGLSEAAVARLTAFEADDYDLVDVQVEVGPADPPLAARTFAPSAATRAKIAAVERDGRLEDWRFEAWRDQDADRAVGLVGPWLALVAQDGVAAADRIWPDLVGASERAAQNTGERHADGAARPPAVLGRGFGPDEVAAQPLERLHSGFRSLDRFVGRRRRFDGSMSDAFEATIVRASDAVAVLAYDPPRDALLLVEQWRAGAWARGDAQPWLIEIPAGAVDPGEDVEAAARRETLEETGVRVGPVERIAETYPAPALADERIILFAAKADLGGLLGRDRLGGAHGEGEDIRAFAVTREAALQAAARGEIVSGFTLLALYWLDRHHRRLGLIWR